MNKSPVERRADFSFFPSNQGAPVPRLPLLDDMVSLVKRENLLPDLKNTIVIAVQHILETTETLLCSFMALGLPAENIFLSGKCYSTASIIEKQIKQRGIVVMPGNKPDKLGQYADAARKGIAGMWGKVTEQLQVWEEQGRCVDRIIILDEGGRCLEEMPKWINFKYKVAGIEQTTAGFHSEIMGSLLFPLIDVAFCATKKNLESPLIAKAIEKRLIRFLKEQPLPKSAVVGIIGHGAIGYGLCQYFLSQGYAVCVYDQNESAFKNIVHEKLYRLSKIEDVLVNAHYIFGCTGRDILAGIDVLSLVKQDKVFISCTSEDKEFNSLLQLMVRERVAALDPLSDLVCLSKNGSKIILLRGGFPLNFDGTPSSVPANDIEITRGLLLGAMIQAILRASLPNGDGITINRSSRECLNPAIQSYIALHWLSRRAQEKEMSQWITCFKTLDWIKKNSGGSYVRHSEIETCFTSMFAQTQLEKYSQPNRNESIALASAPKAKL